MSQARTILDSAGTGCLGTLDEQVHPFVSLVAIASLSPTRLAMLLSGLAIHTRSLQRNSHCSLLLTQQPGGKDQSDDPLATARITLTGQATRMPRKEDQPIRERFLARHPTATIYADFADFSFFQFQIELVHLVTGFGRIETFDADQL